MKKVIAWLLVLALTAAISIGATLAYLTDTDEDVNVMTLGKVKIDQLEYERVDVESKDDKAEVQEFHDNKPLLPAVTEKNFDYTPGTSYVDWEQIGKDGYTSDIWNPDLINNEVDKMVFVKNKGDYDAYVRSVFAFEAGKYTTLDQFRSMVHLNLNETDYEWEWLTTPVTIGQSTYFVATATYNKVLAPGALTEISLSQIALDKTATNEDVEAFGDTYQVLVKSQGIQADGFDNPEIALTEGFGEIDADHLPWTTDAANTGSKLKPALRYINGDKSLDSRTLTKNVIIDKADLYPEITANYKGTLVDVAQDVPVYVYYVPNGEYYDIYALSSDKVYADTCYMLFYRWRNLETVYCPALDTSRAEARFSYMFTDCNNLTSISPTAWDTSSATTMYAMFAECHKLTSLDVTTWDTSNVSDAGLMFIRCRALTSLVGSGNLDFSKVPDMGSMFEGLDSLTYLDATNWNCGSCTNMVNMFKWALKLETVEGLENWDVSNVESFSEMFRFSNVEKLDLSGWKPSSGKTFNSMFADCKKFNPDPDVFANWDMRSAVRINHMFDDSGVQHLNLSNWDMPNLITTTHMFADCTKLESVNFTGWNTPNLISIDCMFNDCHALTYLDVSSFDTANCEEFSQLFEACWNLEKIDGLTNFVTNNAQTYETTFSGCNALTELDLSTFNTRNVVNDHYMEWQPGSPINIGYGCLNMFSGMNSLKKLILSENFSFDGDGKVTTESYKVKLPNPAPIDGQATKWYNEANDTYYDASEIPEPKPGDGIVTYVAAIPPANP